MNVIGKLLIGVVIGSVALVAYQIASYEKTKKIINECTLILESIGKELENQRVGKA